MSDVPVGFVGEEAVILAPFDKLSDKQRQEVAKLALTERPESLNFYVTKRGHLAKRKKPVSALALRFQKLLLKKAKGKGIWLKCMGATIKIYEGK